MDMTGKALATICLIYLVSGAYAVSVGTAPGVYDVGELKPGRDYPFAFYLTTNSRSDILVTVAYIKIHADIYDQENHGRYTFIPKEASQEEIDNWIKIPRNQLVLSQNNVKDISLEGGGVVKAYGTVNVVVHVPEDAEPGYHAGAITLNPQMPSGEGGTGVVTFGVTRFVFVFRVAGTAIRKGEIMTLYAERLEEKKARLNVLFKNTGTVSVEAWVDSLKLYDKIGNLTAELRPADRVLVKPGQITELHAIWQDDKVKPGSYRAEAVVSYLTGSASIDEKVDIPAAVQIGKKQEPLPISVGGLPWMTIILIIIIILLLVYYFKED